MALLPNSARDRGVFSRLIVMLMTSASAAAVLRTPVHDQGSRMRQR